MKRRLGIILAAAAALAAGLALAACSDLFNDDGLSDAVKSVSVTVTKDDAAWADSGKTVALYKDGAKVADLTDADSDGNTDGTYAASGVASGTYDIYVDGKDTGVDFTVGSSTAANIDYYTVDFSSDGIVATPSGESTNPVLKGGTYSFTIELTTGTTGTPVLTLGGTTLTPDANGVYTVSGVSGAQTVTVDGLTVPNCAAPVFSVKAGNYGVTQNVTLTTTTNGAKIYYTTDGTDPTSSSTAYTGAVEIAVVKESAVTLKAITIKSGRGSSDVVSAKYSFYYNWYFKDTSASTFYIEDAHSLWQLANLVNKTDTETTGLTAGVTFNGRTVQLTNDIDLSTVCSATLGDWTPIGKYDSATSTPYQFEGTFDGNGREIKNIYIDTTEEVYGGLFSFAQNLKNLTVSGEITTGTTAAGIVCEAIGDVINCCSNVTVKANDNSGGITAYAHGLVMNCTNNGSVYSSGSISHNGGIVGSLHATAIINCKNTGSVSSVGYSTGGICGENHAMSNIYIVGCVNTGTVTGFQSAGGILGDRLDDNGVISTCLNSGSVTVTEQTSISDKSCYGVGGIVACTTENATIVSCCSWTDTVSGTTARGGIVGYIGTGYYAPTKIQDCYYKKSDAFYGFGYVQSGGTGSYSDKVTNKDASNNEYTYTATAVENLSDLNTTDVPLMNTAHDTTYDYMFKTGAAAGTDLPTVIAGAYKITVTFASTGDISLSSNSFSKNGYTYIYAETKGMMQAGGTYAWYFNNGSSPVCSSDECSFGKGNSYNVDSSTMVAGKAYLLVVTYTVNSRIYTAQCQITKKVSD